MNRFTHPIIFLIIFFWLVGCQTSIDQGTSAPVTAVAPSQIAAATGEPTPTSPPASTPLVFPTPVPPKTLYEERFDDGTTCFRTKSLEEGVEIGIEDERYILQLEGDKGFSTNCHGGFDNFVMDFEVQMVAGDRHSIFGLTYRTYLESAYTIYFTGANEICWDYYDAETNVFRNLVGCWAKLPHFIDIREPLRIRLIAAKEDMAIVINDALIAIVADGSNDYGRFGFYVGNKSPAQTRILIDNILIREIQMEDINVFRSEQTG